MREALAALAGSALLAVPAATPPPYRLHVVATGLRGATFVTAAPGAAGRLYVVQRNGLVRAVGSRGAPFLDLRSETSTNGERGLLSIAFHPDFTRSPRVYAFYTASDGAIEIAEFAVRGGRADSGSARTLVHVAHPDSPYHNGGQLAFGPDGRLYAGIGDGGYTNNFGPGPQQPDPHGNSQNLDTLLGKIVSLDVDAIDAQPRIAAYGLRNPWRFSFGSGGELVVADVGYRTAEEIDVLEPTAAQPVNFGWSVYEGAEKRPGATLALDTTGPLVFPALTYRTGSAGNCAITGGYRYRGSLRSLRGRYVFGDYCSGRIWSVVVRAGRATGRRLEPVSAPGLTSFGEDAKGELYAVTLAGTLYRF